MLKLCKASKKPREWCVWKDPMLWISMLLLAIYCVYVGVRVGSGAPLWDPITAMMFVLLTALLCLMYRRGIRHYRVAATNMAMEMAKDISKISMLGSKVVFAAKMEWLREADGSGDDIYANLPRYYSEDASGFDVAYHGHASILGEAAEKTNLKTHTFAKGTRISIPTGWRFQIPEHFELQLRPRSSMIKRGIRVELGTVDRDYTGEVHILIECIDDVQLSVGDRLAQLVLCPVARAMIIPVREFKEDGEGRGSNGFGSTGQ